MHQRVINPWTWQDDLGFVQAHEVVGAHRVIFCAGQFSGDEDGRPLHSGDMRLQLLQALANLETALERSGLPLSAVVRLNYFTVDVDAFLATIGELTDRLAAAGCHPASTLLGVTRLASPHLLVEIEATAVAET